MKKIIVLLIFTSSILFASERHYLTISTLAFANNGNTLYSASFDSTCIIWNVKNGKSIRRVGKQRGFMTSLALSERYKRLLTTARDKTIGIRTLSGRLIGKRRRHSDAVNYVIIKNRRCFTASDNGEFFIWNFPSMRLQKIIKFNNVGIDTMAVSPDGKLLIAGCTDGKIRVVDVRKRYLKKIIKAHSSYVFASAFLDNSEFVTASDSGEICKWDRNNFKLLKKISYKKDGILNIASHRNYVIAGTRTGKVLLLSRESLKIKRVIKVSAKGINALAVHPSGKLFATGDDVGNIRLYDFYGKVRKIFGK